MAQKTNNNSDYGIFILFVYIPILILSIMYISSWFVSFGMFIKLVLTYIACRITFDALSMFLDYLFESAKQTTVTVEEDEKSSEEKDTTDNKTKQQ